MTLSMTCLMSFLLEGFTAKDSLAKKYWLREVEPALESRGSELAMLLVRRALIEVYRQIKPGSAAIVPEQVY